MQLLCINDCMVSRLASELIFIDGLKEQQRDLRKGLNSEMK